MIKYYPKYQVPVFISSTFEDLVEHRTKIKTALDRIDVKTYWMEYFGAGPSPSRSVCLENVRKCQLVITILGMRYGSIDSESGLSFTHLEYKEAKKLGIQVLAYLIDENEARIAPKFVDVCERAEKLKTFKAELLKNCTVGFFSTPDQLSGSVTLDILPLLDKIRKYMGKMAKIDIASLVKQESIISRASKMVEAQKTDIINSTSLDRWYK